MINIHENIILNISYGSNHSTWNVIKGTDIINKNYIKRGWTATCHDLCDELNDSLFKIVSNKTLDITTQKVFYIREGCKIPRNKLSNFCKNNDLSVTRKESSADVSFVNSKLFRKNIFQCNNLCKISINEFNSKLYGLVISRNRELMATINSLSSKFIFIYTQDLDRLNIILRNAKILPLQIIKDDVLFAVLQNESLYNEIITNNKLYLDSSILKLINTGPVIDDEMFDQLGAMFKSSDDGNHIVAMEIMANCNYEESILNLCLLFRENASAIYNKHEKNHVNFKSLVSYLDIDNLYSGIRYDTIFGTLIENNLLTRKNYDKLISLYCTEISDHNQHITFTNIVPSENIISKIIEPAIDIHFTPLDLSDIKNPNKSMVGDDDLNFEL